MEFVNDTIPSPPPTMIPEDHDTVAPENDNVISLDDARRNRELKEELRLERLVMERWTGSRLWPSD